SVCDAEGEKVHHLLTLPEAHLLTLRSAHLPTFPPFHLALRAPCAKHTFPPCAPRTLPPSPMPPCAPRTLCEAHPTPPQRAPHRSSAAASAASRACMLTGFVRCAVKPAASLRLRSS